MSDKPSVCAVMLTRDRPEMARQAVECFRRQTYQNKKMTVFDGSLVGAPLIQFVRSLRGESSTYTIGQGRNEAIARSDAEIIVTWDDDDWSHPNRIAEQVALLQSSGADVVGYSEMLFWREPRAGASISDKRTPYFPRPTTEPGEAWLFCGENQQYPLGTSLAYWRRTWERKPFDATSHGEDWRFCMGLKVAAVSSGTVSIPFAIDYDPKIHGPRMVARIHSGNTSGAYEPKKLKAPEWRRVPEWDSYCRSIFETRNG